MIQLTKNNLDIITFNIFKDKALCPSEKENLNKKWIKDMNRQDIEKEYKLEIFRNMFSFLTIKEMQIITF